MKKNIMKALSLAMVLSMLFAMSAIVTFAATLSGENRATLIPSIPERPTTVASQADAYETILPPGIDEENWYGTPYHTWKSGNNPLYQLSDMSYLISSNTPNDNYPLGQPTAVNHPYSEPGSTFRFGNEGKPYVCDYGIGMHPKNPYNEVYDRQDSWTVYNISAYTAGNSATPADTFYTLVGLTSQTNAWGSKYKSVGVYVYIYGDKTGDGQHYELLAASELIQGDTLGEFNVRIEGVKLLLIDVILPTSANDHAYSGVGFGSACLFKADPNAQKPDYSNEFEQHQHSYDSREWHSATQHKTLCMTCLDIVYEKHTWNDGVITTNPTCTQKGVKTYTCTGCGYTKVETVEQGHSWNSGVIITNPTCEQPGVRTYTCTECGNQKTETVEKAHTWMKWIVESDTQHKRRCSCGATEIFDHVYDDEKDPLCNDCKYQRAVANADSAKNKSRLRSMLGCNSTLSLGASLALLCSIGSAGLLLKEKKE